MKAPPSTEQHTDRGRRFASAASAWSPVLLYMGVLFVLSAQSRLPEAPGPLLSWDKMQHLLGYAGLMLVAYRAVFLRPLISRGSPVASAFLITIVYGALDEIHQMSVPGRSGELQDWLADVAGGLVGTVLIVAFRRLSTNGGRSVVGNR